MLKYKLEITQLSTQGSTSLPPEKRQMLMGMLTLLTQAFKGMSEVQVATLQEDHSILIEATQDLDFRLQALGSQVKISKLS